MPRSRGGALLAVLWLSAALAAIAFSLANTVRGEAERTSTAVDATRAYYLASGGIRRTALHMIWTGWNPNFPPQFHTTNKAVDLQEFPTGRVRVEIIPETSKLNINQARPEDLFRLLVNLGVEPDRAQAITAATVDWRTPGPPTEFDQYYESLSPSFRSRHASFEEIEELLVVRGMTPDIFYGAYRRAAGTGGAEGPLVRTGGLADCVSVFGAVDRFDVNTAQPALLDAVGVPPDVLPALVERRSRQPFSDDADLARSLAGNGAALNHLRVGGNTMFTLRATAQLRLPDGRMSDVVRTVAALVQLPRPGYGFWIQILRWYDTAWGQP
jgi:general secretion pathway protein K